MEKRRKRDDANASKLAKALMELGNKIGNLLGRSGERATEVPGLMLYRSTAPTVPSPCTYEPSLLLIPQGRKRVDLGRTNYDFGESRFLLTSLELPVVSQVITASEDAPYLAFFLKLDISTVRDILNTEEVHVPGHRLARAELLSARPRLNWSTRVLDCWIFLTLRGIFHSSANSCNARSYIACCRERRDNAFGQWRRWETRASGRRRRLHGYVRTTRNLCVWNNWRRSQA